MKKNSFLPSAVLPLVLLVASVSCADEFHYNNILIGDRASGMGGAYTAVSDDPGGMYYNPAGIAYSTGKSLSASVNAYSVSNRTYKSVFSGQDWTRTSATLLPNFFGIIQPVGKFKLGFSYAVPDSNQEDQDQSFLVGGDSTLIINFNNKNDTNLFGPSAAVQLSDSFSIGTTLYLHKRSTEAILNMSQSDNLKNISWTNYYRETDELGIKPILGLMWTPVDKVSLGMSVTKTFVLRSEVLDQTTSMEIVNQSSNYTNGPVTLMRSNEFLGVTTHKRTYPYQVNAGVAFFPNSSLLITGDLSYYSPFEIEWVDGLVKREAVLNGALGTEYYVNKNWAVRAGLFTDFSNTPKIVSGGVSQLEHIDMYGGSLTVSHFTKNTSLSCGGSYKYGIGKHQLLSSIQDVTANTWTIFVSSSYSY